MYKQWQLVYGEKKVLRESDNLALLLWKCVWVAGQARQSVHYYGKNFGVDDSEGKLVDFGETQE